MSPKKSKSAIEMAAARLRAVILKKENGALLGSEDELQRILEVSRPTMRQAARMVEREGLLVVKRGNNGGYFGARPDPAFIEATVSTYLEVLDADPKDLTLIASVLWVEVVRRAAALKNAASAQVTSGFRKKVSKLTDDTGFSELLELDQQIRSAVFDLIKSPYVELIFNINGNFARRYLTDSPSARNDTPEHTKFVDAWRKAKLLELDAIANGDEEIATLAAQRARNLVHERVWL